jgi:hypothetical protein
MRIGCFALVILLAACKDKQEQKPAPAAAPPPVAQPETREPKEASPPAPLPPPGPTPIKPAGGINTAAEYEARALQLLDELTAVFEASGTNCEKLARNIDVFVDKHRDALAATDQFEAANPSAEDDLEPKLQEKAKVFMQRLNISMQACQKHEGVKAALAKLPE